MSKKVFVTVGTTSFDPLLQAATSSNVLEFFKENGYSGLVLQKGRGDFELESSTYKNINIECYNYKDSIADDISSAHLVLSHAGAGSILETLSFRKSLIVVVNEDLMDNHQYELASKMADEGYLYYCSGASALLNTLKTVDLNKLKQKPIVDKRVFREYVDRFVGFEKNS